ncbi:MAG TPA: Shedu immune nuclease family protein [Verrucomicrobiae bacterium]|nr:Shedu immune nuclease family protein [Verrucomicrobiae bacterium]
MLQDDMSATPTAQAENIQTRLDKWKEPRNCLTLRSVTSDGTLTQILAQYDSWIEGQSISQNSISGWTIIECAKELIFDLIDGKPVFYIIQFGLNVERFELKIDHVLDMVDMTDDQIKSTLATALSLDVPVYPNTAELTEALARLHKSLLESGFSHEDSSGKKTQLKVVKNPLKIGFQNFDFSQMPSFAELHLMREAVRSELSQRDEAGRILANLKMAIQDLETVIGGDRRNENKIQSVLTGNPILFGVEYSRIIPKHLLGSDYEMDYAIQRISGFYDLVEIEASTHKLYTKSGNPTKELIHAEQQVLDWFQWMETNSAYAQKDLPNIQRPFGYIIIGRRSSLTNENKERLHRRNITLRATMQILTYDDLLDRAKSLLGMLQGQTTVVA